MRSEKTKLRQALKLLRNGKAWVNHYPEEPQDHCILTACGQVVADFELLYPFLPASYSGQLGKFNDAEGRTFADIKSLFERAIAAAE
jgi:hypothetical protein